MTGPGHTSRVARRAALLAIASAAALSAVPAAAPSPDWIPSCLRPTAIVARNDGTAVGALQALKDAGLQVPADISVTGFDNIPLAPAIAPALTTMSHPTEEVGRLAAEFLIARLDRPQEPVAPRTIVLQCNLIVRASTAPPAQKPAAKTQRRQD
jgi:DNA-binding LacI/PurR family transcriptional regulator